MQQGDAISVARATKHGVLLILHFCVLYYSSTFFFRAGWKIIFNGKISFFHFSLITIIFSQLCLRLKKEAFVNDRVVFHTHDSCSGLISLFLICSQKKHAWLGMGNSDIPFPPLRTLLSNSWMVTNPFSFWEGEKSSLYHIFSFEIWEFQVMSRGLTSIKCECWLWFGTCVPWLIWEYLHGFWCLQTGGVGELVMGRTRHWEAKHWFSPL